LSNIIVLHPTENWLILSGISGAATLSVWRLDSIVKAFEAFIFEARDPMVNVLENVGTSLWYPRKGGVDAATFILYWEGEVSDGCENTD
jgi:hypothetical protein